MYIALQIPFAPANPCSSLEPLCVWVYVCMYVCMYMYTHISPTVLNMPDSVGRAKKLALEYLCTHDYL